MNKKEETKKIKEELAKLGPFRLGCYVCRCKSHRKGMTFHHKWYLLEGDVIYSVYKKLGKIPEYYPDLKPLILKNPQRFMYLCTPHHQALERLKRLGVAKFNRLIRAVRMSR